LAAAPTSVSFVMLSSTKPLMEDVGPTRACDEFVSNNSPITDASKRITTVQMLYDIVRQQYRWNEIHVEIVS